MALLHENGTFTVEEVKALVGSSLTNYGPLIPDALGRYKQRDPEAWNFADRVRRLFAIMEINQKFFSIEFPTDQLSNEEFERSKVDPLWARYRADSHEGGMAA